MVDSNQQLVTTLATATGYNVYYELTQYEYTMPCITYQCYNNEEQQVGDNLIYSSVAYYVKLWGTDLAVLIPKMQLADAALKNIGYQRVSYNELAIDDYICLVAQYRGLAKEERSL